MPDTDNLRRRLLQRLRALLGRTPRPRSMPLIRRNARPGLECLEGRIAAGDLLGAAVGLQVVPNEFQEGSESGSNSRMAYNTSGLPRGDWRSISPILMPTPIIDPVITTTTTTTTTTNSTPPVDNSSMSGSGSGTTGTGGGGGAITVPPPQDVGTSGTTTSGTTPTGGTSTPTGGAGIRQPGQTTVPPPTNGGSTGSNVLTMTGISDDTGSSASDRITSDNTLTINGTGQPGAAFSLRVNGVHNTQGVVGANGTFSVALAQTLGDGMHTISIRPAGAVADTQSLQVTVDSSGPAVFLGGRSHWVDRSPTLSVSANDGRNSSGVVGPIVIDIDQNADGDFGDDGETGVMQVEASGINKTFTLPELPEGNWDIRARAVDALGNVGSSTFRVWIAVAEEPSGAGTRTNDPGTTPATTVTTNPATAPSMLRDVLGGTALADTSASESEPNNTAATADPVTVPTGQFVNVTGSVSSGTDEDWFRFTLGQRNGVFFDIDSRETGQSTTLDSILTLYNASGTQIASNDNGYDFDTGLPAQQNSPSSSTADSGLYQELTAGTYYIRVTSASNSTGNYILRMARNATFNNQVPALNSLPGATDTIFLDFNGHSATDAWGTYNVPAFDINGTPGEFGPSERLYIQNVWAAMAEDFSPFNINVSTNYTGTFNDGVAMRVVINGNDGSAVGAAGVLGIAFLTSYAAGSSTNNVCFVFQPNFDQSYGGGSSGRVMATALETANTSSHEVGHTLGLLHFATSTGSAGSAAVIPSAILATPDTGLNQETWTTGTNQSNVNQDDMAIIANATNGFGLRTDDYGNTQAAAFVMTAVSGAYQRTGIINHVTNDIDFFRFAGAGGGTTSITVNVNDYNNDLDVRLRVFDSAGTLLGTSNPGGSPDGNLSLTLASGNYFVEVASNGTAGSAGQYAVTVVLPGGTPPGPGPGPGPGPTPTPTPNPGPPPINLGGNYARDPYENNNTSSEAVPMGALVRGSSAAVGSLTIHGAPSLPDYDWYRWTAASSGTVRVTMTALAGSGDLELTLYRKVGNSMVQVAADRRAGVQVRSVAAAFVQGTQIFVHVKGRTVAPGLNARGAYVLNVSLV